MKINAERQSLLYGGMSVAPPVEHKYIPGQTREERVAVWESTLAALDRELAVAG